MNTCKQMFLFMISNHKDGEIMPDNAQIHVDAIPLNPRLTFYLS